MINLKNKINQTKDLLKTFQFRVRDIPVYKILLGGENDLSGYQYSLLTGDYFRPSTKAKDSPHAQFLLDYIQYGEKILEKEFFQETSYFKNAQTCIDLFGDYFPGIDTDERISLAAERFIKLFDQQDISHLPSKGHSKQGEIIIVSPIENSDFFQLVQGNHRVAFAIANKLEYIKAKVNIQKKEITPIQFLLESLQWEQGDKILYQPLPCPELQSQWVLARNCEDRLNGMKSFLKKEDMSFSKDSTYLDLGSYYGWFVNKFIENGFDGYGVEKDNVPIQVGEIVFPNIKNKVFKNEITRFLKTSNKTYNIVSCLSIMHHFITQRENRNPEELLRLLDKTTNKILFFEMGEEHEKWFSTSLKGWNVDTIEKWVLSNTSFKKAYQLGRDIDSQGKFSDNFGRMLFAFVK